MSESLSNQDITNLMRRAEAGDPAAMNEVLPVIYEDLRRIAHARLRRECDETLSTTGLVHERWLSMSRTRQSSFENRQRYFAYAAKSMRHVLIDRARQRAAGKRQAPATAADTETPSNAIDSLGIDQALTHLSTQSARLGRIVELRLFVGLSSTEIGDLLGVNERTVDRDWLKARALLSQWLTAA